MSFFKLCTLTGYTLLRYNEVIKLENGLIRSFADKSIEKFFISGKVSPRHGWLHVGKVVKRKLDMLDYASSLIDLRSPPNNCLEKLIHNLEGFYSIRVNDQWRIIFRWDTEPFDVDVVDYH